MINTEKWIFFPMEIKARELDSKLLLAFFALKKDYTVVFAHHNTLRNYINYFPRGVYFYKDLSFYKNDLFKYINELGFNPEEVLMVGDSLEKDVKGAINAGLDGVLLDRKDEVEYSNKIKSLKEVLEKFRK